MNETPFFFASGAHSLFGVLHLPATGGIHSGFVFCHPLAEEKLWTHRVLVLFARALAADGHAVLRFDCMGSGDSEGQFSDSSLGTGLADVRSAIEELRRRTGLAAVNLLGLRFGATMASLAAEANSGIDKLVLWAPIEDGDRYMQELLRSNLTTQMATYRELRQDRANLVEAMRQGSTANVDGYEMSYPLFAECSAIRLAAQPKRHAGPCLIVQIDRQPRPAPDLQRLAECYPQASLVFAQEEPFWKEIARSYQKAAGNLFAVTREWLRPTDGEGAGPARLASA